jgi:beta-galactosidase/beta-glucuronidase
VFHGVDSAFYCWLNSSLVGFSKDSRLPAEFEVTRFLKEGNNLLAVQVKRPLPGYNDYFQHMKALSCKLSNLLPKELAPSFTTSA